MYTANHLVGVKAIICLTESGSTPRWMSRIRSGVPIYALTRSEKSMRRMTLFRGVEPMLFDATEININDLNNQVLDHLKAKQLLNSGDLVLLTRGAIIGSGSTNSMQVLQVP